MTGPSVTPENPDRYPGGAGGDVMQTPAAVVADVQAAYGAGVAAGEARHDPASTGRPGAAQDPDPRPGMTPAAALDLADE